MSIAALKELTYKELRDWFRHHMELKGWYPRTVDTYYTDAFYVWRKENAEVFWSLIESERFDEEANAKIMELLLKYSSGKHELNVKGYFRALDIFRSFCITGDYVTPSKR